jgi:serine protease Do
MVKNEGEIVDEEKNQLQKDIEEMDYDNFFTDEEALEWEKEKKQRKKRKKVFFRIVSPLLVVALLISGLEVWFNVFNIPAIHFIKASNRLSRQPDVKEYKKSVVTIEWDGVKGTGFNIAPDGLIVTNNHVVEKSNRVNVHTKTSGSYPGKVIANYPELDLAIVDIETDNLPILKLNTEKNWGKWKEEKIIFIGNPLFYTQIANEGTVVGQVLINNWDLPVMMIKAPIYKGNSGSPVINENGEVIGIIFATLQNPDKDAKEIIGAAVPSFYLKEILENN